MGERIKPFIVRKDISIKNAMKQMDEAAEKILFVVDQNMRLLGSLSDGDIRRWILADKPLTEKVEKVFNKKPFFVNEDCPIDTIKEIMLNQKIEWVPRTDNAMNIVDVCFWEDIFGDTKKRGKIKLEIPVVIMAGGKGLRLDPFTRILPKPLIPVGEKPVIEIIMDHFKEYGCHEFFLIIGYKAEMIKSYFDSTKTKYRINYIREDKPLGTAGGLSLLPEDFSENFFVSNCDTIIKADYNDIYNFHIKNKYDITLIGSIQHLRVPYGVIELNKRRHLEKIIEKPEHDFLANTGMYVLKKRVLNLILKSEPFHIPDLVDAVKRNGGRVGVYPVSKKSWLDIGQWEEYRNTIKELNSWVIG